MEPGGSIPHLLRISNNPYLEPNKSKFHKLTPIYLGFIRILYYLRQGLPKSIFPVGSSVKHFNILDLIILILSDINSSLWRLIHSPLTSLLGLNICSRILFSNTLILLFPLKVRDYVTQSYCTTGNIIVTKIKSVANGSQLDFCN
jgi:hypothetical protein